MARWWRSLDRFILKWRRRASCGRMYFSRRFDLEQLYEVGLRAVKFVPLGKYPAVERDFSFVFAR